MGYLDALTDPSFKRQEDGSVAFYPHGTFGRGYVLPSGTFELQLRRSLKISYVAAFAGIFLAFILAERNFPGFELAAPFVVLPLYFIWFELFILRSVRKFAVAPSRLTLRDAADSQARTLSWLSLVVLGGISLIFVATGLFIVVASRDEWFAGTLGILFGAACSLSCAHVVRRKLIMRRQGG